MGTLPFFIAPIDNKNRSVVRKDRNRIVAPSVRD